MIKLLENIAWLGHSSFRISTELIIFVDPWQINEDIKADLIFITHSHYDHCSVKDVARIVKPETVIITTSDSADKLRGVGCEIYETKPGDKGEAKNIKFEAVHAYNINKDHHPKSSNWVGYILEVLGERLYFAGDTDYIPEMKHLHEIDVAFLPIGGEFTMGVDEAIKAALEIHPKYVVPTHYGEFIGDAEDAENFASVMDQKDPTIEVVIKTKEM